MDLNEHQELMKQKMKIIIHRGAMEIGGTCIELSSGNTKILLDIGLPLNNKKSKFKIKDLQPDAILISHPHLDHYGLLDQVEKSTPVYVGELTQNIINASRVFNKQKLLDNTCISIENKKRFKVGDFTITPYLVDHSAIDAYAFLIQDSHIKVFYSGDFRAHGRKSILFKSLVDRIPEELKNIDALILEGTLLGREPEDFSSEKEVEDKIRDVLEKTPGTCYLVCSSQNIDRMVSAFKAAVSTGRMLVIDIYTAWILKKVADSPKTRKIPNLYWKNVKVLSHGRTAANHYCTVKENPEYFNKFIRKIYYSDNVVTHEDIAKNPHKYLIKTNWIDFLIKNTKCKGISIIYSMWKGYLEKEYNPKGYKQFQNLQKKYNFVYAHTSGHAYISDLKKFANTLEPKVIIPVHTEFHDIYDTYFRNALPLKDGRKFNLAYCLNDRILKAGIEAVQKPRELQKMLEDIYPNL
ncbi:MBL fold metallo-hydrolase [candidate division KSB1 bacterium]